MPTGILSKEDVRRICSLLQDARSGPSAAGTSREFPSAQNQDDWLPECHSSDSSSSLAALLASHQGSTNHFQPSMHHIFHHKGMASIKTAFSVSSSASTRAISLWNFPRFPWKMIFLNALSQLVELNPDTKRLRSFLLLIFTIQKVS